MRSAYLSRRRSASSRKASKVRDSSSTVVPASIWSVSASQGTTHLFRVEQLSMEARHVLRQGVEREALPDRPEYDILQRALRMRAELARVGVVREHEGADREDGGLAERPGGGNLRNGRTLRLKEETEKRRQRAAHLLGGRGRATARTAREVKSRVAHRRLGALGTARMHKDVYRDGYGYCEG